MSARRKLIAELSEDSMGGIATLQDVERAEQLVDAHAAEVLAEVADPTNAATVYASRLCGCEETPHPTWCPASVPTDARIAEIRNGAGGPLTLRELSWLKGAAERHALHVIGARGLHWPLTDDLSGALLLVSQYLAAAVAVVERAGLAQEAGAAPDFFEPGRVYVSQYVRFHCIAVAPHPEPALDGVWALGWDATLNGALLPAEYGSDDWKSGQWMDVTEAGAS